MSEIKYYFFSYYNRESNTINNYVSTKHPFKLQETDHRARIISFQEIERSEYEFLRSSHERYKRAFLSSLRYTPDSE